MRIFLIVLLSLVPLISYAQPDRGEVRSGNRAYEKGEVEKAEIEYRRGLEQNPDSFFARYNLGNALYKKGNSQEAEKIVTQVPDSLLNEGARTKIFHNLEIGRAHV